MAGQIVGAVNDSHFCRVHELVQKRQGEEKLFHRLQEILISRLVFRVGGKRAAFCEILAQIIEDGGKQLALHIALKYKCIQKEAQWGDFGNNFRSSFNILVMALLKPLLALMRAKFNGEPVTGDVSFALFSISSKETCRLGNWSKNSAVRILKKSNTRGSLNNNSDLIGQIDASCLPYQ